MTSIDLIGSPRIEIPYITEDEARLLLKKGWSFSSTYYFSEIRDVYLALRRSGFANNERFTQFCISIDLPFVITPWNERRILEHLNALKNFALVSADYSIVKNVFDGSEIGKPLSDEDLAVFRRIYFDYLRFKELFSWFIDLNPSSRWGLVNTTEKVDTEKSSRPLFVFSERGKLKDSFLNHLVENATIYYIRYKDQNSDGKDITGNEDLMRFWDVFVRWGVELKVLEYFSLRDLDIKTSSGKDIACCYVINNESPRFNLLDYIRMNYDDSYIHLPELVFKIASEYRLSIEKTKAMIIDQYQIYREVFSFERTSEIFIRGQEIKDDDKILFPKYHDSYISHMVITR